MSPPTYQGLIGCGVTGASQSTKKGAGEADAQVGMHSRGFGKTGGRELTERLPKKRIPQLPG
jgi:hypothetical protein